MKKLFALLVCLSMLLCLSACGKPDAQDETEQTENQSAAITEDTSVAGEVHDHNHISFNGRVQIFTPEELSEIVGREYDFTYDQNGNTIYIYNDLTIDSMTFTQVQFTFGEDHNRISCTYSADDGTEEEPRDADEISSEVAVVMQAYEDAMTELYGEGTVSQQHGATLTSWADHTGNYIILTQLNDTTVQLAFYLYAS